MRWRWGTSRLLDVRQVVADQLRVEGSGGFWKETYVMDWADGGDSLGLRQGSLEVSPGVRVFIGRMYQPSVQRVGPPGAFRRMCESSPCGNNLGKEIERPDLINDASLGNHAH